MRGATNAVFYTTKIYQPFDSANNNAGRKLPCASSVLYCFEISNYKNMKKTTITFITAAILFTTAAKNAAAQSASDATGSASSPAADNSPVKSVPVKADSTAVAFSGLTADNLHLTTLKNYGAFKKTVAPLIGKMGMRKIVGLGEGTHGTAEFYKLRYWITRLLVEEKGFNHIAFENDFSDCWFLNKELQSGKDLNGLMKKYFLSIWQNEEVKELLYWLKDYNSRHAKKVRIDGLDYVMLGTDVNMLKDVLNNNITETMRSPVADLTKAAALQDAAWEAMNKDGSQINMDALSKSGYQAYLTAESLDKDIQAMNLPAGIKENSRLALDNLKQGFAVFYTMVTKTTEVSRDSCMALTAAALLKHPDDKMIIWAHNGHVAKNPIYNGVVGGAGGHLAKMYPHNYFVLGTGTATGTFAATTESRDTYTNPMLPYQLETPIEGSWEELFSSTGRAAFYFDPALVNRQNIVKPLRFVGYTPKSGPKSYDKTNIASLYDAFIFIKDTHAATPLK
jgi:erythromycin esterase